MPTGVERRGLSGGRVAADAPAGQRDAGRRAALSGGVVGPDRQCLHPGLHPALPQGEQREPEAATVAAHAALPQHVDLLGRGGQRVADAPGGAAGVEQGAARSGKAREVGPEAAAHAVHVVLEPDRLHSRRAARPRRGRGAAVGALAAEPRAPDREAKRGHELARERAVRERGAAGEVDRHGPPAQAAGVDRVRDDERGQVAGQGPGAAPTPEDRAERRLAERYGQATVRRGPQPDERLDVDRVEADRRPVGAVAPDPHDRRRLLVEEELVGEGTPRRARHVGVARTAQRGGDGPREGAQAARRARSRDGVPYGDDAARHRGRDVLVVVDLSRALRGRREGE